MNKKTNKQENNKTNMLNIFTEKQLLQVIRFCLYATLATPLVYSSLFLYPAIVPKAIFFRIVVTLAFITYALLLWKNQQFLPRVDGIFISLLVFIAWAFVASILNPGFGFSFFDGFERMEGLINYFYLFLFFVVAANTVHGSVAWHTLIRWSAVVSTLAAAYALLQVFDLSWVIPLAGERVTATLGNAGLLAGYLLLGIFLTLFLIGESASKKGKVGYALLAIVQFSALYCTQTRGAFLGLLVGIAVYLAVGVFVYAAKKKLLFGGALALLIAGVVAAGLLYYQHSSNSVGDDTIQNRLLVWRGSGQAMLEQPIFGWGAGNFEVAFNAHYDPALSEIFFDHAHNSVLDMGVRFGAVGAFWYLLFFVVLLRGVRQAHRFQYISAHAGIALSALLIAYFIHNFFLFDSLNSFMLWLVVAAYISSQLREKNFIAVPLRAMQTTAGALAVIAFVFLLPYNIQPARAAYAVAQAEKFLSADPYASARYFQKAAAFSGLGRSDIANRLAEAAVYAAASPGYNALTRNELFRLAEKANQNLIAQVPEKLRPRLSLASVYIYAGNNDSAMLQKAEEILWQALNVAPKKFESRDLLVQVYIRQKRWERAAAEIEVVLSSRLRTGEIYFLKGLVSIYMRDAEIAQSSFTMAAERGRVFTFSDYVTIGRAYEANDYQHEAIAAYETARVTEAGRTTAGIDFVNRALYELYTAVGDAAKAAIYKQKISL